MSVKNLPGGFLYHIRYTTTQILSPSSMDKLCSQKRPPWWWWPPPSSRKVKGLEFWNRHFDPPCVLSMTAWNSGGLCWAGVGSKPCGPEGGRWWARIAVELRVNFQGLCDRALGVDDLVLFNTVQYNFWNILNSYQDTVSNTAPRPFVTYTTCTIKISNCVYLVIHSYCVSVSIYILVYNGIYIQLPFSIVQGLLIWMIVDKRMRAGLDKPHIHVYCSVSL